ncbi:MAG: hypothetical protein ACLGI8_02085 [Acidimicrobiia bacterium]
MAPMRLRLRRPATTPARPRPPWPEGWRRPRWARRGTTIGTLDGGVRALVDPAGLVTPAGGDWSLDWWVGAEDRWHLPAEEVAVRQRLVSNAPVVETRVRIPSGDAVHRAYAARTLSGDDVVVVEVENASKVPFAVALAVRPAGATATGEVGRIELEDLVVHVDGEPGLVLQRAPGRAALGSAEAGDAADAVLTGGALEARGLAPVTCSGGLANAAFLFPLAHTAVLRVVLPLGAGRVAPAEVPSAAEVASGWSRQAGAGTRVELPDRRLRDAVAASARHLLLADAQPAVAEGLDWLGHHGAAAGILRELVDPDHLGAVAPGRLLAALGLHWDLTRGLGLAGEAVLAVAAAVAALGASTDPADRRAGLDALPAVGRLLRAAGEDRAASDLARLELAAGTAPAPTLGDLLRDASATWTWPGPMGAHDPAVNATLVGLVRALLVDDQLDPAAPHDHLDLGPAVPDAWLGQGWEVHDLPTRHGWLSYAVRWHGDRPALLWQLDLAHDRPVVVRAPGLDPTWHHADPVGEELLAPVALPQAAPRRGLSLPVSIEPLHRRPTGEGS